ncbi:hypothetical protein F2Q69_00047670 [Brassica cretica]|uniref:DUF4283 domain-containing protein n=1 Tax=Brassica cretica TaxID=69181 RepID=A0A8S9PXY9_BRACR|nr:hypothetical protein F2Q69_00047670 [Brassica cretica]
MGSLYRAKSTHMVDLKGKGILYEDDDEPIKLSDQDDSEVINEYRMSLIRKHRITTNDLGNGKFLFNFTTEEDLMLVLQKGPFHYNYCMFVLVRWEPIVHDDYPWVVPYWVQLIGMPLHLWTVKNMMNIGSRIGHVDEDTIDLIDGRMRIDVDSRRPLKFKRKVESSEREEVTIEIKYDMLFKHCTTCGLMSHEKGYCPTLDTNRPQSLTERGDVFARVQLPLEQFGRQPLLRDYRNRELEANRQPLLRDNRSTDADTWLPTDQGRQDYNARHFVVDTYQSRSRGPIHRNDSHSDRIIGRRDEKHNNNRYGSSRYGTWTYDRKEHLSWREKSHNKSRENDMGTDQVRNGTSTSREAVLYDHTSNKNYTPKSDEVAPQSGGPSGYKRLASAIVTPSRQPPSKEDNITIRDKSVALSLTFSPQVPDNKVGNDQIIGPLNDMEIMDPNADAMMDYDVQDNDLLGEDFMDVELHKDEVKGRPSTSATVTHKSLKGSRSGAKFNVPLRIQSKKMGFLRRGSPCSQSVRPSGRSNVV